MEIAIVDKLNDLEKYLSTSDLDKWIKEINIFDVLKISRMEIRHSNMLAWLLDPHEKHNLGDAVLRNLLDNILNERYELTNISVIREWHNIDIFIELKDLIICIENKIDSKEHGKQLENYKKYIEEQYPEKRSKFIYLTPHGASSSDPDNWKAVSYKVVLDAIEKAISCKQLELESDLLINNYINIIRREIVGDKELEEKCREIYNNHKDALDLIFEHKPDRAADVAIIIRKWAKSKSGEIIYYESYNEGKRYTRFKTKEMTEWIRDVEGAESDWKTSNFYFYEIENIDGEKLKIKFTFNKNDNLPEDLKKIFEEVINKFSKNKLKDDWRWRVVKSTNTITLSEEINEEDIFKKLDKSFKNIINQEKEIIKFIENL